MMREMLDQLTAFEEGNVEYYSGQDQEKKLINNPANGDVKNQLDDATSKM